MITFIIMQIKKFGGYMFKKKREKERSMRSIDTSASCRVPWFKHTMSGHVIGEPQPS